ncbi:hypothetical protein [Bacteroides sp. Marseille-P3684]|uniref:competence protein CoiA family protein n=1 Tax=Bacteroides sp. Marseille-P3684 TaxID=2086579 RepID=UPI000D0B2A8F|nr:hypothetical protein [Bacteroides sp. Marseille-P3684]
MGNDTKYLKYALNTKGELVHIDSVPNGNDCGCICPACKKPLQAKNKGTHRTHHFAHQSGVDCPTAYESSLHLLAKKKIQEAFYESQAITISFEYKSYCSMNDTCMYVKDGDCVKKSTKSFNLKEYYDRCEQEISYNNINRRSDLKFSSSIDPNKEPLYLEIYVTHASDSTKLHSGNKIIEAKIEKEEDIDKIIENGFIESPKQNISEEAEAPSLNISFYGFKNSGYSPIKHSSNIRISRYMLYSSGKFICKQEHCKCNELHKSRSDTLYEFCFHSTQAFELRNIAKWLGYKRFKIENCQMCINYVDSYNGTGKICRRYSQLNIPRTEHPLNTSRAKTCTLFVLNEKEMKECLQKVDNKEIPPITEFN